MAEFTFNRILVRQLFSDETFTKPHDFLSRLESQTGWFFVIGIWGNIAKYEDSAALKTFGRLAIGDIRCSTLKGTIRTNFFDTYKCGQATRELLEAEFPELQEFQVSIPLGNPRFWREKFLRQPDDICELLATDRTNYASLILPHTEFDVSQTALMVAELSNGHIENPLSDSANANKERLLFAAYSYMDTYLAAHRDRWMKFFEYLTKHEKTKLLKFWYPDI